MSTAQGPVPGQRPGGVAGTVVRRLAFSYLVQFLVFVAVLMVVVVLLARQPEGCACTMPKAQIILLGLGGMLALAGTVVQVAGEPDRARTGVALLGTGVVLAAVAGLVGFW